MLLGLGILVFDWNVSRSRKSGDSECADSGKD